MVDAIGFSGTMKYVPCRTETDLCLFPMDHSHQLPETDGDHVIPAESVVAKLPRSVGSEPFLLGRLRGWWRCRKIPS